MVQDSDGLRREDKRALAPASVQQKIFVAMPFAKEFRDIWRYGIQSPVRNSGLLCERLGEASFTGDVVGQIKERIQDASLVIADLTGNNPNVFLETGYAWGLGRQTVLLFRRTANPRKQDALPFDVRSQKCIFYEDATDLEEQLSRELKALLPQVPNRRQP